MSVSYGVVASRRTILVLPPRAFTTRWALPWRISSTRGSV